MYRKLLKKIILLLFAVIIVSCSNYNKSFAENEINEDNNSEYEYENKIENEMLEFNDLNIDSEEKNNTSDEIVELDSNEYVIEYDKKIISKVLPKTEISVFKSNFNVSEEDIKVYQNEMCQQEITQGYIGTGMCVKYIKDNTKYKISVCGDINKDGEISILELNRIIDYYISNEEDDGFDNVQKMALDVICDNELNVADITAIIRYLAYGELDVTKTTYTIEYYKQKIETDEYELVESKTKIDSIGEKVRAEILTYEGFTLTETSDTKLEGEIYKDGSLKLKLYYKRNINTVQIKNVIGGNIIVKDAQLNENRNELIKYDEKIKLGIEVDNGYAFNGWKISNEDGKEIRINLNDEQLKQYSIEINMPNENIIIEPKIILETYKIDYYLNEGVVSKNNPNNYNILQDNFTLKQPTRNGYRFRGWTGSNGDEPEKELTIKKGTSGNLYFVANWVLHVNAPTIICENEKYTNNSINVTIVYPEMENTINQYRKYGENWITIDKNPCNLSIEDNTIIYARTLNQQGEVTDTVEKRITNIDKTKPEIKNIFINKKGYTNQNIKITVLAQDRQSGIIGYMFCNNENIDGNSDNWEKIETTTEEITKDFIIENNGTYYFYVKDSAGNITKAEDGKIEISTIESTKPIIKAVKDNQAVCRRTNIQINIDYEGISKLSEDNSYQYYLSTESQNLKGGTWKDYVPGETFEEGENLTGEYNLFVKEVKDELGNTSIQNGTKIGKYHVYSNLIFDNTAPKVIFESNGNNQYQKEQKTKVYIEDIGQAGVNTQSFKYLWTQNSEQPSIEEFNQQFSNEDEIRIYNQNGIYYLWIMVADNVGNTRLQRSEAFYLDNQIPSNEQPSIINISQTSISVEVNQKDEKSKIDTNNIYFGIRESNQQNFNWIKSNSKVFIFNNLDPEKRYDIKTKVIDNAGNGYVESEMVSNIQATVSDDIYIMQAPTTWTNGNVSLTIMYPNVEGSAKKQYSLNNQDWIETESNKAELNIDHNTIIYTRILDQNEEIILNKQYEINNIDKQKAIVEIVDNNNNIYEVKDENTQYLLNVNLLIKENESGILKKEYAWSDNNVTIPIKWSIINDSNTISTKKSVGEYYLWIRVKDNAQNETVITSNKYIIKNKQNYVITYVAQDATGVPSSQKKYINESINLSTNIPSKLGYVFIGWSTNENATECEYKPGDKFETNANTILYALWKKAIYKNGNSYYIDLSKAVKNAKSNNVITVLESATDDSEIIIDNNITIDLNGKSIDISKTMNINENCTLNINGTGNITTSKGIILIENKGVLNLVGNINLSSTSKESEYTVSNIGTCNIANIGKISNINKTIGNAGSLVIKSGIIESKDQMAILNVGNVKINGGTISSVNNVAIQNGINGIIEMHKGTITGETGIVHDSTQELKILGGTITGTKQGIRTLLIKSGNIILGKSTETSINKNPNVTGQEYGIQTLNNDVEIILYNGVIRGKKEKGYVGNIKCRQNYEIMNIKSGEFLETSLITQLEKNYSIGDNKYVSLDEAVKNAKTGDTIKLIRDVNDIYNVTIDKNLIIDTNSYSLARTMPININENATVIIQGKGNLIMRGPNHSIINRGILKITHQGIIRNENTGAYATINNYGTIEKTGTGIIDNLGKIETILNSGNMLINAGKITAKNSNTIRNNKNNAKLEMNGGLIENTSETYYAIHDSNISGIINIKGGNVTSNYKTIYNEKGKINISGGNIRANYYAIRQCGEGNINITGGIIEAIAKSNACGIIIENSKNTTKITGGTVRGTDYGICDIASSSVIIGTNSGTINQTNPVILGGRCSLHMPSATTKFYLYGGVLKGKITPGYYGQAVCRSGYSAVTGYSEGYFTTTQGSATFSINTVPVSYAIDLTSALANAKSGSTITMLKNNTINKATTINKNITLNTNGKTMLSQQTITIAKGITTTISGSGVITSNVASKNLIVNLGTLKITHIGTISRTNDNNDSNYVIVNYGTINKTGKGIIKANNRGIYNTGSFIMSAGTILVDEIVAINNTNNGTTNLNGGTIESKYSSAIYNNSSKMLIVNGATIKAIGKYNSDAAIKNMSNGSVKLKKGIIQGYYCSISNESTGKVYIEGGTVSVLDWNRTAVIENNKTGEINISGGTLKGNSSKIINKQKGIVNINGGVLQGEDKHANQEIVNNGQGTINFKKGTIKTCGTGIKNESNGTIKMTGGTITTIGMGYIEGIDNGTKGNFVMTGGIMNISGQGCAISGVGTGSITISGGKINAYRVIITVNEKIKISGGTLISKDVAIENNGSTTYNSGKGTLTITGGKIMSTGYNLEDSCEAIHYIGEKIIVTGGTIRGFKGKNNGTYSGRTDMIISNNYSISNLKYSKTKNVTVTYNGKKITAITFK